jgi:hypothetical protein
VKHSRNRDGLGLLGNQKGVCHDGRFAQRNYRHFLRTSLSGARISGA